MINECCGSGSGILWFYPRWILDVLLDPARFLMRFTYIILRILVLLTSWKCAANLTQALHGPYYFLSKPCSWINNVLISSNIQYSPNSIGMYCWVSITLLKSTPETVSSMEKVGLILNPSSYVGSATLYLTYYAQWIIWSTVSYYAQWIWSTVSYYALWIWSTVSYYALWIWPPLAYKGLGCW
jgi:hypothetical protein